MIGFEVVQLPESKVVSFFQTSKVYASRSVAVHVISSVVEPNSIVSSGGESIKGSIVSSTVIRTVSET